MIVTHAESSNRSMALPQMLERVYYPEPGAMGAAATQPDNRRSVGASTASWVAHNPTSSREHYPSGNGTSGAFLAPGISRLR